MLTYFRSPRALSPIEGRENFETTFDLEGNVETVSTASGAREDQRSLGSSSENRFVRLTAFNVAPCSTRSTFKVPKRISDCMMILG